MRAYPHEEYDERLSRIHESMGKQGLDGLILTKPEHIYYTTGYRSMGAGVAPIHAVILSMDGEPKILLRMLERKTAAEWAWVKDQRFYRDYEDPFAMLSEMAKEMKMKKIGLELGSFYMSVRNYEKLKKAMPRVDLKDATGLVDEIRITKTPREINNVKKAAEIANKGFRKGLESLKVGVSHADVVAEVLHTMYKAGQDDLSTFAAWVWGGPTGGLMHDTWKGWKIKKNDYVTIEIIGSYHLLTADAMGTVYMGNPSDQAKKAYKVALDLHDACRSAIKPGSTPHNVHAQADRVFRKAGYGPYYRRAGLSMGIFSTPNLFLEGSGMEVSLVKGNKRELKPGIVLVVQPGVDTPAMMIVNSTVLVTKDGHEELCAPLRELRGIK